MLLNYDFLEFVDEPQQGNTSLTSAIDKALADKKLARQNKPRVKIKGGLSLRASLDAFGEELSRLKNAKDTTIKGSTLRVLVLTALSIKSKADYLLGLSLRLDLLKTLLLKTLLKKNENY
ncbi:hypothetical protein HpHA137_06290 [Helicobacter pylori]